MVPLAASALSAVLALSCGGGSSEPARDRGAPVIRENAHASLDKNAYPVFPNADAGADPSVPADQGGRGFTGQGWTTNTTFDLTGDPRSAKGGVLHNYITDFPGTLRMAGPEWNTYVNYMISQLVYEQLLDLDPTTLQYVPMLATHWQISPDKMTFRFRLDPNARFSDGSAVTSDDVVATWEFLTDKTLQDLYFNTEYNKLEKPVAESKYVVRFKAKTLRWDNFLTAGTLRVFPAKVLRTLNGASYLRDYNFKLVPGTGPYAVADADVKKGTSISVRRRKDYWAAQHRWAVGKFNFDEIRNVVVRDANLAFEQFKKGDIDYYRPTAKEWAEQLNIDEVSRVLIVKSKTFNAYPADTYFLAFNTRRQPWNDLRVRKAFTLLLNRDRIIKTLLYNEFVPLNSFFPGTIYENQNNAKNLYDPQQALQLLADAGWKDRDPQGRLVKDGRPLQINLIYDLKDAERWLTVYQEDLRKVGIGMNLQLVTYETGFKIEMQRQFDLIYGAWGVGSPFPNPRPEYHSSTADILNTNNISGFKDKRIDDICDKYDVEFDLNKRAELIRELDGILTSQYQYINLWRAPAQRLAYWNRFGMPKGTYSRIGDWTGSFAPGVPQLWWIDPVKDRALAEARGDSSKKLSAPPLEDRYWEEFGKKPENQLGSAQVQ